MKRLIPLVIGLLLIAALILVNHSIGKNAKPDVDDDDAQTQSTQKTDAPKPAPATPSAPGSELTPELTVGNPATAKYKITVGWVYDETTMLNPQPLLQVIQVVQKAAQDSGGAASAEVVNLDVPAADVSPTAASVSGLGVAVNGTSIGPSAIPGEEGLTAEALAKSLTAALH